MGLGPQHLGIPLDENFRPLRGAAGQTLFPHGQVVSTPVHRVEHDTFRATSKAELKANLAAWAVEAHIGYSESMRYASYRALNIVNTVEVNDRTPMRKAPPGAKWYLWRVHMGHSYEGIFQGHASTFDAGVAVDMLTVSGGLSAFASENSLQFKVIARGVRAKTGQAIFARSEAEIRGPNGYTMDGAIAPIFVEYRAIPGARLADGEIAWVSECPPEHSNICALRHREAPGMRRASKIIAGPVGSGRTIRLPFTLRARKCYTVIAAGERGVLDLDVQIIAKGLPMAWMNNSPIASDNMDGAVAIIGGGGKCLSTGISQNVSVDVIVSAPEGTGRAAVQILAKQRRVCNPPHPCY